MLAKYRLQKKYCSTFVKFYDNPGQVTMLPLFLLLKEWDLSTRICDYHYGLANILDI
jgi:hypothetical protein